MYTHICVLYLCIIYGQAVFTCPAGQLADAAPSESSPSLMHKSTRSRRTILYLVLEFRQYGAWQRSKGY